MNIHVLQYSESLASKRWLIILTIMLLAILEVLDSTIVNVALRPMMATLNANQNQITWVLTSYVVASAVILPLTGFLMNLFGRKTFILLCASGFMVSSFLCGISTSLTEMIVFRIFQGLFGSSLIPTSQAILRETFPLEEQGKAMAIWGLGIMAAPVCGPTLGGFITQHASWRWVFYINLPMCLIGIVLIILVIKESARIKEKIDNFGLALMVMGVAALQIFLDKGNENDWFNSNLILALALISAYCLTYFLIRTYHHKKPLINLTLYRNRNFRICSLLMMLFCACLFAFVTLQPIMLQSLFGYTSMASGWTMAPLGIASGIGMILASTAMQKINVKYILTLAVLSTTYGAWCYTQLTLNADLHYFLRANACLGFGMGCFMVPLSTYALATISHESIVEASGLFSYARMLGTSIGISVLSTLVTRSAQQNWHQLSGFVNPFNPQYQAWLAAQHATQLSGNALAQMANMFTLHSNLLGFIYGFNIITFCLLLLIPLIWRLENVKLNSDAPAAH